MHSAISSTGLGDSIQAVYESNGQPGEVDSASVSSLIENLRQRNGRGRFRLSMSVLC